MSMAKPRSSSLELGMNVVNDESKTLAGFNCGEFNIELSSAELVSESEMTEYRANFAILQKIADLTQNTREQDLPGSYQILRVITGFAAESSLHLEDMQILVPLLQKAGVMDRFALMRAARNDEVHPTIINIDAAKRILVGDTKLRSILAEHEQLIPSENSTTDQIVEVIQFLYGCDVEGAASYARRVFSGFPQSTSTDYANLDPHDKNPLIPMDEIDIELLASDSRQILQRHPIPKDMSVRKMSASESRKILKKLDTLHTISIYGIDIRSCSTPPHPNAEELRHCQRLIEIDQKLGLSTWLKEQHIFFIPPQPIENTNQIVLSYQAFEKRSRLARDKGNVSELLGVTKILFNQLEDSGDPETVMARAEMQDIWRNLFTAWALQSGVDAKPYEGLALECMAYGTNYIYAHEEIEDDPTTLARLFPDHNLPINFVNTVSSNGYRWRKLISPDKQTTFPSPVPTEVTLQLFVLANESSIALKDHPFLSGEEYIELPGSAIDGKSPLYGRYDPTTKQYIIATEKPEESQIKKFIAYPDIN